MITRDEADAIAAVWARRDTLRRGYECTAGLHEFDLGFVVWSRQPAGVLVQPDDGGTTVIDRETGELALYPSLPPSMVAEQYRQDRPRRSGRVRTADPAAELRRELTRRPTPTTVAHLTVGNDERGYDLFLARGAKGDVTLRHHPLVAAYLAAQEPGHVVRGAERHAELIVLSDALHEMDRRHAGPLTEAEARELLRNAQLATFRVREPGDPASGQAQRPVESSIRALVHFGVLDPEELVWAEEREAVVAPPGVAAPDPARFPPDVATQLTLSAWEPNFAYPSYAQDGIDAAVAVPGREHVHEPFPAALAALSEFPMLATMRRGPGREVWVRRFEINPGQWAHNADTLADFGRVLGVRLFPLGTEEGDSILAVDERGHVFALDQAGEWFLGATIDDAIITLMRGLAPRRVRDDGRW